MLEAAFGWAAAGLTGISAGAMGAVGGVAALGGYSLWAAENPEDAAQFEQYLAENVVSQDVGGNQQLAMNLQAMPSSLKDSIIDYTVSVYQSATDIPVIPQSWDFSRTMTGFPPSTLNGQSLDLSDNWNTQLSRYGTSHYIIDVYCRTNPTSTNGYYTFNTAYFYDGPVVVTPNNTTSNYFYFDISPVSGSVHCSTLNGTSSVQTTTIAAGTPEGRYIDITEGRYTHYLYVSGVDLGGGYTSIPSMSGVSSGLSGAFDSLVAGTGTAADVAVAGGVEAIYLPNIAINDGTVTVDDAYDASGVTYPDIAITIDGGGGTVPVPTDVLTALQQIIGLLSPMGIVTGIPPIVQDIDNKMSAIVDNWPGVMDILDGLGLLPPIVQDIADGMGVIIDIPQSLEDITDILLPIPQSLQGLLDGVTIDIPQTLAQILNGTLSIPTAIDGVISGVAALPAAIAGALDIDWVLENTEELKDRLPDLEAPIILPQASFDDLRDIANDYKERTPLGKIFEAYEGTFEVMSTSPQGAPRYEITFPSPINFSFVIDFAIFDGLFVQLAHAFFYLLAIFWYLKFIKRVKSWIDSWLTLGGGFAEVAEEESYAFRE